MERCVYENFRTCVDFCLAGLQDVSSGEIAVIQRGHDILPTKPKQSCESPP